MTTLQKVHYGYMAVTTLLAGLYLYDKVGRPLLTKRAAAAAAKKADS